MEFARVVTLKERVSSCAGGCMLPSMAPSAVLNKASLVSPRAGNVTCRSSHSLHIPSRPVGIRIHNQISFRIVYLADDGIHRYHQFGAGEIPGTYILAYGSTADDDNIHIRVEAVNHHFEAEAVWLLVST